MANRLCSILKEKQLQQDVLAETINVAGSIPSQNAKKIYPRINLIFRIVH